MIVKKNLLLLLVGYLFVVQLEVAGILRDSEKLCLLGGINFIVMILLMVFYNFFTREKEKKSDTLLVKERVTVVETQPETLVITETQKIETTETASNEPTEEDIPESAPLSESNIEYIKTKINQVAKSPIPAQSRWYRLIMFLLAVLGLGGILYLFWETLDIIALMLGALGMMIFLAVIFRLAHLRQKTIFLSGYFLIFLLIFLGSGIGLVVGEDHLIVKEGKEVITKLIDEVKALEKGAFSQSGDVQFEENEISGSTLIPLDIEGSTKITGNAQTLSEDTTGVLLSGADHAITGEIQPHTEETTTISPLTQEVPTKQVTMLEVLKHLITINQIPLSQQKNVRFSQMATTDESYPYMKTALEKRMIGSLTNPNMIVSCDTYMVLKGLAEDRKLARTSDIKGDYWNAAQQKNLLNGCQKGHLLTVANL